VDTYRVNGTEMSQANWFLTGIDGLRDLGGYRASNITLPGRQGDLWQPKPRGAKPIDLYFHVHGGDHPNLDNRSRTFNEAMDALTRAFTTGRATLQRTRTFPTGDVTASTTVEQRDTIGVKMQGPTAADVVVPVVSISGFWADAVLTQTVLNGTGTVTNPGDAFTTSVTVTLSAGAQKIVNRTTDSWVHYTGGGAAKIDVDDFKVTVNGASVLSDCAFRGNPYWLGLAAGPNDIQLQLPGSATFAFRAAWL